MLTTHSVPVISDMQELATETDGVVLKKFKIMNLLDVIVYVSYSILSDSTHSERLSTACLPIGKYACYII